MIASCTLKKRPQYLAKLIAFQDTEPVKIVTGIRRCGKSSLLRLMEQHLRDTGIAAQQIVTLNFESFAFRAMTAEDIYAYVQERAVPGRRMYLFFDELQRVPQWEEAVNAFRVDFDCDIYVTGSNAYLLSSEYATYLAGRYVEIRMLPLSLREFLDFHGLELRRRRGGLGGWQVTSTTGDVYSIQETFAAYLRFGGMPGLADVGLDVEKARIILDGIYSTVVVRDIMEREERRSGQQVTDAALLQKIVRYLADSIGSPISVSNIGGVLENAGLLAGRRGKPSTHTVQAYIAALLESYFFYEIKRYDIKGKAYLRTLGKYYIVDMGLRNFLLGERERDRGHVLENVVYLELLRRGYDVAVGKVRDMEIDFIATTPEGRTYYQVTESMQREDVRERELAPLRSLRDGYLKVVLSMDAGRHSTEDGIRLENLVEWLLSE